MPFGSSGVASKAANRLPSVASSSISSWETAAPAIRVTGGRDSGPKHIWLAPGRRQLLPGDREGPAVPAERAGDRVRAGGRWMAGVVEVSVELDRGRRPDGVGDPALVPLDRGAA